MPGILALLPWPDPDHLPGGLPPAVQTHFFDGTGEPGPDVLDAVDFYVLPYSFEARHIELASRMPRLRVVQTLTAGYEHLSGKVPAGVMLCNAAGVHDAATSELAVGLILARLRGIDDAARDVTAALWNHRTYRGLADARVLILGFGGVGQAVARRLAGFEVEVVPVAHSARTGVHGVTELPDLLPDADVVVIAVPLTEDTVRLVDAAFLARMRPGALLVNVARGRVVDTDALLAALNSGHVQAALDVTDPEPLPADHRLWSAPNLLITPHVGGNTAAFPPRGRALAAAQLRRYAAREPLANVIIDA